MAKPRTATNGRGTTSPKEADMKNRTCTIDGCDAVHRARGWCSKHWDRWARHGDPLAGRTFVGVPLAHYYATVETITDDCILWPYGLTGDGYGRVLMVEGPSDVHVLACGYGHGPRPDGMEVRHFCRNRHCYNPRHLRWGTRLENAN